LPKSEVAAMRAGRVVVVAVVIGLTGCGTTRMTDTQRAASEMLLVSQAIDNAIGQLDLSALQGKTVFLDTQYLDGTVDKGYLISSLRQHLLAHGALIQEERGRAMYVVEPRSGAVGTDKHSLLVGTPQMSLPATLPGVPTTVPEIALIKNTNQRGVAKLAVFAYNRQTGRALWQSGLVDASSTLKDRWVFGAGPFSTGSIRRRGEFAGEEIPRVPLPFVGNDKAEETAAANPPITPASVTQPHVWVNADQPLVAMPTDALGGVAGAAAATDPRFAPTGR
jgi:hypothetical protein